MSASRRVGLPYGTPCTLRAATLYLDALRSSQIRLYPVHISCKSSYQQCNTKCYTESNVWWLRPDLNRFDRLEGAAGLPLPHGALVATAGVEPAYASVKNWCAAVTPRRFGVTGGIRTHTNWVTAGRANHYTTATTGYFCCPIISESEM